MSSKEPSFVMVDGRRMAYDEVSPSHPKGMVLLLAGRGGNRLTWYKQLEFFGRAFRTIALDYRDAGNSDPVSRPYTIADLADDAAAVLSALGVQRAHIVGLSMGGSVALQLALHHPEQVAKLVLVSSSVTERPPSPQLMAQLGQLEQAVPQFSERFLRVVALLPAAGYFENHPEDWDRIVEHVRSHPQSQAAADRQMQAALTHDVSRQLAHLQVPTLVVHGELDPAVVPENGRSLAQQIPGARLLLYPTTGHLVHIERAEQFNRDVLAFLQE